MLPGQFQDDLIEDSVGTNGFAGTGADDTSTFYAVQAGIERKWNDLGKTTVYGEYYNNEGGANGRRGVAATIALTRSAPRHRASLIQKSMFWVGIAQGIDAASMTLYMSYRHIEGEMTVKQNATGAAGALRSVDLDDLDIVMTGAHHQVLISVFIAIVLRGQHRAGPFCVCF